MQFRLELFWGLLLLIYFGGKAEEADNPDGVISEDNPTVITRFNRTQNDAYLALIGKPGYKDFFDNLAVCWDDVLIRQGRTQTGDTNAQPRYFCANVPNGWWDRALKEGASRISGGWNGYDYFTPGAKFWLGEPNFNHWLARPMDPFMLVYHYRPEYTQDFMDKETVPSLLKRLEFTDEQRALGSGLKGFTYPFMSKILELNKRRREAVEKKGLFWKVSATGIGIRTKDKKGVSMILKGWYHLHITIERHESDNPLNPTKLSLVPGPSKEYIIDRLMISARGVRLVQRGGLLSGQKLKGAPYLIKGVTGGVGRFVHDFPGCTFKFDHPNEHENVMEPNYFVAEQELPCGAGNAFTHELGNNFIYVRTNNLTKVKYGGDGKAKSDLHVNFRIHHPPCGHVYELDFVVVGVVVKKDKVKDNEDIQDYLVDSLKLEPEEPSVFYVERSMSTRFHFIKTGTTPMFYGAADPMPITIDPQDLSCSIKFEAESRTSPIDPKAESFYGAIKKIQEVSSTDPFAELNDPSSEVFNPITVMYPDLYSKRDYYIQERNKEKEKDFKEKNIKLGVDGLYYRYFKPMTLSKLQGIAAENAMQTVMAYCPSVIKSDGQLEMNKDKPDIAINDASISKEDPNKQVDLFVSPFRQIIDTLTRFPLWDFTCVGGGAARETACFYPPLTGQFVGICLPITETCVSGFEDNPHAACDFGLWGFSRHPDNVTETQLEDALKIGWDLKSLERPDSIILYKTYFRGYVDRYDGTSTVRKYMNDSPGDWENYNLAGNWTIRDLEAQKQVPGHRALNLKLCEAAANAKKSGEPLPKCWVLPPRPFTETPPPPTEAPTIGQSAIDILGITGVKLGDPAPIVAAPIDEEKGDDPEGNRSKRRNKSRDKKKKRAKNKKFIPGEQKGKAIDDDLALFEWDTRIFHGVAFTLLTTFVIPVNAFLTRHFKETFMSRRIYNLRVWYFFHMTAAIAIPAVFIVGLARGLMTSGFLGHSYSAIAVAHRALGWLSVALSLAMLFFGWIRHMNLQINWIIVALHWSVGYLIYFLMLTCTLLAIWIPGSPAAYFDVTYVEFALANLEREIVFLVIILFLAFDISMHVLLTVLQCRNDRLMLLNGLRLYLPAPIPVLAENSTFDAPGYIWRKIILIIYVFVAACATATIITVMCLYSPLDRGFGAMTCTHTKNDVKEIRHEYLEGC